MIRHTAYALALVALFSTSVIAQKADMQSPAGLPEACGAAPKSSMGMPPEPPMMSMDDMTETQKALHMAMMKMDPAMMKGMMASDPDVAWICAMIPHHQGAIDMAKAGLKTGDNAEAKRIAEKTIREQEKDIAELLQWVERYAKREGN